jgi:Tfp pilus assembly protein PilF
MMDHRTARPSIRNATHALALVARLRVASLWLAGTLVACQLTGCASTGLSSSFLNAGFAQTGSNDAAADPASDPAHELPPAQASEACLATARELQSHGHAPEAIILYERARQLNPRQKQISRFLAVLYDQQGNDQRALVEYRKALELTPKDPALLNDFGYYYYRRRDWRQAEEFFRKAIAAAPDEERAWVNLGLALGEQGRYQESFDAFAKVVGPAAAHSNVGVILASHQRLAEARSAFQHALAIQPDLPQAKAFLAHLDAQNSGPQMAGRTN